MAELKRKIIPVIMAGGAGTRLWPSSRDAMPKQFIPLFGGRTSFQETVIRVSGASFSRPIIVTAADFRFVAAEQMAEVGIAGDIVLEPERRDSAAAVAVGTCLALAEEEDPLCLVLAADHQIAGAAQFVADCQLAAAEAEKGRIMTIGIRPTHADTGFGYLAPGEPLATPGTFALQRFVEKPDLATAETYVESGYLWNSGNFLFRADVMRQAFAAHAPAVLAAAEEAVSLGVRDLDFLRLDATTFAAAPKISVDHAVMDKIDNGGMVLASFEWSDVGTWDSVHKVGDKDEDDNLLIGNAAVLDTRRSLVKSDHNLTTVIGLDDVIVVSTLDAVLVAAKSRSADVKVLVEQMKAEGRPEATQHLRAHRPWGWYQRIDVGSRHQVKHICVKPGGVLSLQRHYHRAEHWVVVNGVAEVTIDDETKLYHENEAAYLPIGCVHRLRNPGKINLNLIEVQVGSYTGEDDIVRYEDIYARG